MANANILQNIAAGGNYGPSGFGAAQARGQQMRASQQQQDFAAQNQGRQNMLFDQGQQDRQQAIQKQQQQKALEPIREDLATFLILPDDNARQQAWQGGLAQHYGADPSVDWKQAVGAFVRSNPGVLGPEVTNKVLEQHFAPPQQKAPEPFTLNAGDRRFDASGKMVASAPAKPDAAATRLVPLPDSASPSGFSYGIPSPGAAAPAPSRGGSGGRLPAAISKAETDDLEAINLASGIRNDMGALIGQLNSGKLQLGPVSNMLNGVRNYVGASNEESRNLNTFKASLEKMRNDSLRLNKGVQTEGDAQRAWNEILSNVNDPQLVMDRLQEVQAINQRAIDLRQQTISNRRQMYNLPELDTQPFQAQGAAVGQPEGTAPSPTTSTPQATRRYNPQTGRIE